MRFKPWLSEDERNISFASFSNDGKIVVYINGKRYVYLTDAIYHDKWKRMIPFSPWKVLNIIKDLVIKGVATQLEPSVEQPTLF